MAQIDNKESVCSVCGEPIKDSWTVCPVCETSLVPLACPQCRVPVKENWKLCPECGGRLVCKSCGRRIPQGHFSCLVCETATLEAIEPQDEFIETVTGMEFVHIPAGAFTMGDTFNEGIDNEKPIHKVQLDSYCIGKYPVTQNQWKTIMPDNPSNFQGDMLPVEQVAWSDVQEFIKELTESNKGKYRFQLPSEAQWEFAARSGGKDEMYAGGHVVDLVAWYDGNSDGTTHPVGTKAPNGLGIYDMSGNVWEWCSDTFRANAYQSHQQKNPVCTDGGPDWAIRGGSWNIDAWSVRCSRRFSFSADFSAPGLGFRLVMIPRSYIFQH